MTQFLENGRRKTLKGVLKHFLKITKYLTDTVFGVHRNIQQFLATPGRLDDEYIDLKVMKTLFAKVAKITTRFVNTLGCDRKLLNTVFKAKIKACDLFKEFTRAFRPIIFGSYIIGLYDDIRLNRTVISPNSYQSSHCAFYTIRFTLSKVL